MAGVDFLRGIERAVDQIAPHAHQRAQHRQIVDLRGEIARADQPRPAAGKLRKIGRPAERRHPRILGEQRPERYRIGAQTLAAQPLDRGKQTAVDGLVEMLWK